MYSTNKTPFGSSATYLKDCCLFKTRSPEQALRDKLDNVGETTKKASLQALGATSVNFDLTRFSQPGWASRVTDKLLFGDLNISNPKDLHLNISQIGANEDEVKHFDVDSPSFLRHLTALS